MTITLALAGDTMLGRGVAAELTSRPPASLVSEGVVAAAQEADLFVLNLECCISERGAPWPDPAKRFFFRAPPVAVETLVLLGVDCVTLANNHALDLGPQALLDTFSHLDAAGIAWAGAGADVAGARRPRLLEADGSTVAIVALSDYPQDFAAGPDRPGVAHADLRTGELPGWVRQALRAARDAGADVVMAAPHWGPNMVPAPVPEVRAAAPALLDAGASLIAGHSAHVFHGIEGPVLYDLGDFLDDYAVDPVLRNDLGLLFLVTLDSDGPRAVEAVPLKLDYCYTRLAEGTDAAWIANRFARACSEFGSAVAERAGRLVVELR